MNRDLNLTSLTIAAVLVVTFAFLACMPGQDGALDPMEFHGDYIENQAGIDFRQLGDDWRPAPDSEYEIKNYVLRSCELNEPDWSPGHLVPKKK